MWPSSAIWVNNGKQEPSEKQFDADNVLYFPIHNFSAPSRAGSAQTRIRGERNRANEGFKRKAKVS